MDSKNMGVNTIKEGFRMKFVEHVHAKFSGGTFQWKHYTTELLLSLEIV